MELRQLRYFVAVADRLNFSAAARAVHVTQSTISHQIKQLEYELGYELFERDRHNVKMTEQGEALLPGIARILRDLDEVIHTSRKGHRLLREKLRLLVGVYSLAKGLLPLALRRFNEYCPDVPVSVEMAFANQLRNRFVQEDYDLAIGIEDDAAASSGFTPLCREELALLVHPAHPLAGRKSIRIAELHGERLAFPSRSYAHRRDVDRCFENAGSRPLVVAEFDNPDTMMGVLSEQNLGGIVPYSVPEWLQGRGLVRILLDPAPTRSVVLYKSDQSGQAAQVLAETLVESAHEVTRQANDMGLLPFAERPISRLGQIATVTGS